MRNQAFDRHASLVVLIVDDVPENLAVLHDALDESGYTVLVANNGAAALERARQTVPDVILLDALMPGMDGFETCRRLRADSATRTIPVIFMTGLTETEHVVTAFSAGGTDYVTKPVRQSEVLARIGAHVQTARLMQQARSALDAFGNAVLAVTPHDGRIHCAREGCRQNRNAHNSCWLLELPIRLSHLTERPHSPTTYRSTPR
jgi:DNA-binding response OmpR family regulator